MSEAQETIDVLEAQMDAVGAINDNLKTLVERMARIQATLSEAEVEKFEAPAGDAFSALSLAAEQLQELGHDMEIERNRIRNES